MAISKSQQKAVAKYNLKAYDRIELKVPKGQKDVIKAAADATGESVNGFITRAIEETMRKEKHVLNCMPFSPPNAISTALFFEQAASQLDENDNPNQAPIIILRLLACEIMLKALIKLQNVNGEVEKTHDLKRLYSKLSKNVIESINKSITDCDSFVDEVASSFEEWRYFYENKKLIIDSGKLEKFEKELEEACKQAGYSAIIEEIDFV